LQETKTQKADGSSTLNRALAVLEELALGPQGGMTAAQLAKATRSNRVSVHRILVTFLRHGYVRQERPGEPYRLGFRFLELGERVISERDLVPLAYPLLEELAERSGETSHLAVLDGSEAVYVAKIESSQSVRLVSHIGARVPLYCTALGKSLLATADGDHRDRMLANQSFEPRTARTKTSVEELLPEFEQIRRRGYAVDDGENEDGVRCVGVAVVDHSGRPVAAISVSGPDSRVTPSRARTIGKLAAETAGRLSAALGHSDDGHPAGAGARPIRA
jgi:DNA-binding IclR family transcriptional regulator